ncbi:hypothetical protein [Propionicimonas sp.]|uniref:hypothetical protein n=1 Tax=Propionicimonas sp. TaxID=1955623 RepID=UPI0039E25BF3
MSESTTPARRRGKKIAATTLLVLGLGGASAAAAAQLGMSWTGSFQAGATSVTADCQPSSKTITSSFDKPTFSSSSTLPWTVANVTFANIDDACKTLNYEAAYKLSSGEWVKLGTGTVTGTTVSVPLGSLDPQSIKQVALSIYS